MNVRLIPVRRFTRFNGAEIRRHVDGRCFGSAEVQGRVSFPLSDGRGLTNQAVEGFSLDNHGGSCLLRFRGPGSYDVTVDLSGRDGLLLAEMLESVLGGA